MKNIKLVFIMLLTSAFFTACNGDHAANYNKDSLNKNPYNTAPAVEKPDSTSGDTVNVDNSGSGGAKIKKDTAKKQIEY